MKASWVKSLFIIILALLLALLVSAFLVTLGVNYYGSDFRNTFEESFKYLVLWRMFIYCLLALIWVKFIKPKVLNNTNQFIKEKLKRREVMCLCFIGIYEISALYSAFLAT